MNADAPKPVATTIDEISRLIREDDERHRRADQELAARWLLREFGKEQIHVRCANNPNPSRR